MVRHASPGLTPTETCIAGFHHERRCRRSQRRIGSRRPVTPTSSESIEESGMADRSRSDSKTGPSTSRASFCPDALSRVDRLTFLGRTMRRACSVRSRVAPMPISSGWSSGSSAPRCSIRAGLTSFDDQHRARSAGALLRRGDQASGAVPAHGDDDRLRNCPPAIARWPIRTTWRARCSQPAPGRCWR